MACHESNVYTISTQSECFCLYLSRYRYNLILISPLKYCSNENINSYIV